MLDIEFLNFIVAILLVAMFVLLFLNIKHYRFIRQQLGLLNANSKKGNWVVEPQRKYDSFNDNNKSVVEETSSTVISDEPFKEEFIEEEISALQEIEEEISEDNKLAVEELTEVVNRHIAIQKRASESKGFEKSHFQKKLFDRFPELTYVELEMCYHLWLTTPPSIIAKKLNLTIGTLRVYKHKIRRKFGLEKNAGLELFLGSMVPFKPNIKKRIKKL